MFFFFFFSSRRRHTRFDCDWSSDVCSSDLSCQNIRPGITLEGHFDGEIERWQLQINRLASEYSSVDERLRLARKQAEQRDRYERLSEEKLAVATDLKDADSRLVAAKSAIRAAETIAGDRPAAQRALQAALVALQEAREAANAVGRLPELTRDALEAK